jgi:hypothetical protein
LQERLRAFHDLLVPVFAASVSLQSNQNAARGGAADPAGDSSISHDLRDIGFTGIVFLNDDYASGELYFPRLDLLIKPTAGLALAFTNMACHANVIMPVVGHTQIVMAGRYVFSASQRDIFMYELEGATGTGR